MNSLGQLLACGQSYWLDNLTRDMLTDGELQQRVAHQGLRGITSNPATFHKAIVSSQTYDAQVQQLLDEGRAIHEIYECLAVTDVQRACDVLRPVYDASAGVDGFVSLEVSPYLAHDTVGTMQEARRLWTAVDRPNVMIKIPGTPAGIPAIEEMLYEGLSINITLLFAVKDYEAVAQAYMRALERRLEAAQPVHTVRSVASFFLSRIDVLVDQLLGHRFQPERTMDVGARPEQLLGQVAVANAKLAYQRFKELFGGERWQALAAHGARVQRPLWASTSTKDPLYHDVCYVEPLIGPETVTTMPAETIAAFAHHGRVCANAIETDLDEARRVLRACAGVGVDLGGVTWQLQNEGVQKFTDPFDALMQALAVKHQELLGARASRQTLAPGRLKTALTTAYEALDRRQFGRRFWAHDPLLWSAAPEESEAIMQQLEQFDPKTETFPAIGALTALLGDLHDQHDRIIVRDAIRHMQVSCGPWLPTAANPGVSLGVFLGMAARHHHQQVILLVARTLRDFGNWVAQAIEHCATQQGCKLTARLDESLGDPEAYDTQQVFVALHLAGDMSPTTEKQLAALEAAGHPVVRLTVPDRRALGGELLRWNIALVTGSSLLCPCTMESASNA